MWMLWETYSWDLQVLIISECFAPRKDKIFWAPLVSLWEGNQSGNTAVSFGAEIRLLNSLRNNSYPIRTKIHLQTNTGNLHLSISPNSVSLEEQRVGQSVLHSPHLSSWVPPLISAQTKAHIHSAALPAWCSSYRCCLPRKSVHIIKFIKQYKSAVSKKTHVQFISCIFSRLFFLPSQLKKKKKW